MTLCHSYDYGSSLLRETFPEASQPDRRTETEPFDPFLASIRLETPSNVFQTPANDRQIQMVPPTRGESACTNSFSPAMKLRSKCSTMRSRGTRGHRVCEIYARNFIGFVELLRKFRVRASARVVLCRDTFR